VLVQEETHTEAPASAVEDEEGGNNLEPQCAELMRQVKTQIQFEVGGHLKTQRSCGELYTPV
jgi:hypothetical protein